MRDSSEVNGDEQRAADIEAAADKLLAWARKEGEELGRARYGDAWETMPKGPDITHLLRADLIKALTRDAEQPPEGG